VQQLERRCQDTARALADEKTTAANCQRSLQDAEQVALRVTKALEDTRRESQELRKQAGEYGEGRSGLLVLLQERDLELQKMSVALREYRESAEDQGTEARKERSRAQALQREVASLQEELSRCRQKKGKSDDTAATLERQVERGNSFLDYATLFIWCIIIAGLRSGGSEKFPAGGQKSPRGHNHRPSAAACFADRGHSAAGTSEFLSLQLP
ncbi:unnamed protein product, partial [Symbiodinium microadriaticum]